ncbi:MAG: hypothetical protein J7K66_04845 [Anaerolineaceae bacterium]|nr:hypothetical protein [Anaerolineaceae bacterium]
MKRELIPYTISRAVISALLGILFSFSNSVWMGILIGSLTFFGFIWYAHSGWFLIDTTTPLTPLRRDARGKEIRNRALVIAVAAGGLVYGISALLNQILPLSNNMDGWALIAGGIIYFSISSWFYIKDAKNNRGDFEQ